MRGKYVIEIYNKKIRYKLNINRNITIIKGDSATGKTKLFNMIRDSKVDRSIKIKSDVEIITIDSYYTREFPDNLYRVDNQIIFVDEYSIIFDYKEFAKIVKNSNNYFVFITREKLGMLPYSYKEIYELDYNKNDKSNYMKRRYENFENLEERVNIYPEDKILVEDSNSGYDLYRNIFERVISSEGKDKIVDIIEYDKIKLVIADGAAIGSNIEDIIRYKTRFTKLYLPESVEYVLLNSNIFNNSTNKEIQYIMSNICDMVDSVNFFSWENFFEYKLKEICKKDIKITYSKFKLNKWFLNETNINKIYEYLSNNIKIMKNKDQIIWT